MFGEFAVSMNYPKGRKIIEITHLGTIILKKTQTKASSQIGPKGKVHLSPKNVVDKKIIRKIILWKKTN